MKPAGTQRDTNMNFDGMESMRSKSQPVSGNQWSGHSNDGRLVNKGRGPTVGNDGRCDPVKNATGNPTKGQHRTPPVSAVPAVPRQGSVRDNINRGHQDRGAGGTVVKKPSSPDSIRIGQSGGPDYGVIKRGSRPVAPGSTNGVNYGPKSQY